MSTVDLDTEKCHECGGSTVMFRGKGLNLEYKVCSLWQKPGHLSREEIRAKVAQVIQIELPEGRWA